MVEQRLELLGIEKEYNGTPVLNIPELKVSDGEFFTLLGPSGSGKTTTLKLIAGFEDPTAGQILVLGKDIAKIPVNQRNIGVVFQNYALFPHMTVAQNIAFPLQMRKLAQAEVTRKVENILELVDLVPHRNKNASLLSGGQQQRVAIARALVFEPEILLMDEPLGALDRKLRHRLQEELRSLQKQLGITAVYVTHDQDEAMSMSDRVAIMNNGVIEQVAVPRKLYDEPSTLFVSNFLGDNNSFSGRVLDKNTVQAESGYLIAVPEHQFAENTKVTITIRPERILLRTEADTRSKPLGAGASGTIRDLIPLGATTTYIVDIPQLGLIRTHIQHWGNHFEGKIGDAVYLIWEPQDVHVFPET